ncbi:MAG: GNAT family N-acetyltransferase [Clostridium sp.]|nr:GNAT family N-acetyltransferase [Clostridium sp.]
MKKTDLTIEGLYKIQEKDLPRCAKVAAQAFLDDESSKFILSTQLTFKTLYNYYLIIYKAAYKKMYMFAESEKINGFIIISPSTNAELSLWDCIKAGAIKFIMNKGLGIAFRSIEYEKNCTMTRNKIVPNDSWYIFQFGVSPEQQGKKIGSKTIRPVLKWLDSIKKSCYLETQKNKNVEIYNHLGFTLKEVNFLPDKKMPQFAMLRTTPCVLE